jgi:xanthine dehydrogenase accessory factor
LDFEHQITKRYLNIRFLIDRILRSLLRNNIWVRKLFKVGDIDPRGNKAGLDTISTKARTIGKRVRAAVLDRTTN